MVQHKCDLWRTRAGHCTVDSCPPSPAQSPPQPQPATPAAPLAPIAKPEQVTVTAYRAPLGVLESPTTTRLLTTEDLRSTAAITFDDQLRTLPGVELFRRSSSLVANPTSQGISLRALGSTSASRTLLTEDDVPLNDPLGGWIHWQEQPELSIQSVELVRGGASDLYGSSAIGGVVNIIPALPSSKSITVRSTFGGEGTYDNNLLATAHIGPWELLAAGGMIGTDGYIQESAIAARPRRRRQQRSQPERSAHRRPRLRRSQALRTRHRLQRLASQRNPYQRNATRLIRYSTGADWQNARSAALALRLYGSDERYRQTFSSLSNLPNFGDPACTYRCGETPSKFSYVPTNELGAAAHLSQPFGAGFLFVFGADAHDVRVWDREQPPARPPRSPTSPTISAIRPPTPKPCGSTLRGLLSPRPAWTGSRTTTATKRNGMAQHGRPPPPAPAARRTDF